MEIYFVVWDGSGYMNYMEIVKKLGENKEDFELEGELNCVDGF